MSAVVKGPGIPRLQELTFLETAMLKVAAGGTFEEVRRQLIEHMTSKRQHEAPTGNHAAFRLAVHNPARYVDNATAALGELMKLGFLERSPLPSSGNAANAYQQRTFAVTDSGKAWADLMGGEGKDLSAGYDMLLEALWRIHPQFAGYLRLLAVKPFVLPTARWGEVNASPLAGSVGAARTRYVDFLAQRAAGAVSAGIAGWTAGQEEIAAAIRQYLEDRVRSAERRNVGELFARNRDFVATCEEALVSFAFQQAGLKLDYISLEILRRWTRVLGIANFSYYVPGPPALRLWATADLDLGVHGEVPEVHRRRLAQYGDQVIDAVPQAIEQVRRMDQDSTWVPIYRVRAAIALQLGLSDNVINKALEQFATGMRRPDAPFGINFESAEFGATPPTETPLRVTDTRTNRTVTYRVMALVRRPERTSS